MNAASRSYNPLTLRNHHSFESNGGMYACARVIPNKLFVILSISHCIHFEYRLKGKPRSSIFIYALQSHVDSL